jgi:hypothetical protein
MFLEPFIRNMLHGAKVHGWCAERKLSKSPPSAKEIEAEKIA